MPAMEMPVPTERLRPFCFEDLMALRALGRMRENTERGERLTASRRGVRIDHSAPKPGGAMAHYDLFNRLINFQVKPPATIGLTDIAVPVNYACFNAAESELMDNARQFQKYL